MDAKNKSSIDKFSKHLFWDVDVAQLDVDLHVKYIVTRVLLYGNYTDWKLLLRQYGLDTIIKKAQRIKELDFRTATFLSVMGNVPKSTFLCYTTKPSLPVHWNF